MEKIIKMLENIRSGVDYQNTTGLITNKIIDSIDVTTLISELEEEFDIEIDMEYMEDKNFDSVQAIWEMVQEIMED